MKILPLFGSAVPQAPKNAYYSAKQQQKKKTALGHLYFYQKELLSEKTTSKSFDTVPLNDVLE